MIFERPTRQDFDFRGDIEVDTQTRGFTEEDIGRLAEHDVVLSEKGAKGLREWWSRISNRDRKVPPRLQNLKSEFGYQANPLLTNLLDVAAAQRTKLEGSIKARSPNYNFYIMRCGVYIAPADGERFEALKFEVRYRNENASTMSMLPSPQTKTWFAVGGKADVGVTAKLDFGLPEISTELASADASAKAKLESKFVVSFDYEYKTPVVDAFGVGNPFCRWLLHGGENLRNDVVFYPIIATPKSVKSFDCEFTAYFRIGHPEWESSELYLKPAKIATVSA